MAPRSLRARGLHAKRRAHRPDYGLVVAIYGLLFWGMIIMFSMNSVLSRAVEISLGRQALAVLVGTLVFWIASRMSPQFWKKMLPLMIIGSVAATVLLLIPSEIIVDEANGARRWLNIAGVSFQPAELVKLTLILYLAVFLTTRIKANKLADRKATLIPVLAILTVVTLFIAVFQRDLGTMMVIAAIVVLMLYIAGMPKMDLGIIMAIGLAGVVAMVLVAPHRIARVTTFLSPDADPIGSGYHIQQSLIAIGSGGVSGVGVGKSVQAFGYLPEAANDSIFAIHAETIGFIGIVLLLAAFAYLLRRLQLHATAAPNTYYRLIIVGIFAWVMSHIVINVGAMLGLLPLTGITLPFLSYGGSSMVLLMLALGIVFQLSRYSELGIISSSTNRRSNHPRL